MAININHSNNTFCSNSGVFIFGTGLVSLIENTVYSSNFSGKYYGDASSLTGLATGGFITTGQTGAFGGAGVDLSTYITTGQTGAYAAAAGTGNFVTIGQTGVFALSANTGSFVTTAQTGVFALSANTGNFVTTGQTGVFARQFISGPSVDGTGSYYNNTPDSICIFDCSNYSSTLQGTGATFIRSDYSTILNGKCNTISDSCGSIILNGDNSEIYLSQNSLLFGIDSNHNQSKNSITFGNDNAINYSCHIYTMGNCNSIGGFASNVHLFGSGIVVGDGCSNVVYVNNLCTYDGAIYGNGCGITGLDTGSFLTSSSTGSFVDASSTGSFVDASMTGSFVDASMTGNFITQPNDFIKQCNNNSFVLGSNNSNSGSYNFIKGDSNVVSGNFNTVFYGGNTILNGSASNIVFATNSTISGYACNNVILGAVNAKICQYIGGATILGGFGIVANAYNTTYSNNFCAYEGKYYGDGSALTGIVGAGAGVSTPQQTGILLTGATGFSFHQAKNVGIIAQNCFFGQEGAGNSGYLLLDKGGVNETNNLFTVSPTTYCIGTFSTMLIGNGYVNGAATTTSMRIDGAYGNGTILNQVKNIYHRTQDSNDATVVIEDNAFRIAVSGVSGTMVWSSKIDLLDMNGYD